MGLDDVQLGFGDRDALGPVIHDTRMPVLAPATADRRCASPWARQIIIKVETFPSPAAVPGRALACSMRLSCAQAVRVQAQAARRRIVAQPGGK